MIATFSWPHTGNCILNWLLSSIYYFAYTNNQVNTYKHHKCTRGWDNLNNLTAIILILIALPSLWILYMIDEINNPSLTIKTIGHQWHLSYEYTDSKDLNFDSYIIPTSDLKPGELQLLEVGKQVVLPIEVTIQMLVSAEDVLHSWVVPSLGLKTDAVPRRLNQTTLINTTRLILWTMLRHLQIKPQLHANCPTTQALPLHLN